MADLGKVVITHKGTYNPATTYEFLDGVLHNGSTYLAKRTVTGVEPVQGDDWQLMAQGIEDVNSYYRLQGGIVIQEGEDLNDPKFLIPGNYYCESNDIANTIINLPPNMEKKAFTMRVSLGTGNGYPVQQIETFDWGRIWRRMYNPYTSMYSWWVKYLDVNDMVNSDTINDSGKVPSSAVAYQLGQEIDSLNSLKLNANADSLTTPFKHISQTGLYGYTDSNVIADYPATLAGYVAGVVLVIKYGNYTSYKITATNNAGTSTKSIDGFFIQGLQDVVWGTPY